MPKTTRRKMHQTTVRFGPDLWHSLETEAERVGVSVAQYVRDAALSRLSYEAGRRAESEGPAEDVEPQAERAGSAQERAENEISESMALYAQGTLARQRALALRAQSERTRAKLATHKT